MLLVGNLHIMMCLTGYVASTGAYLPHTLLSVTQFTSSQLLIAPLMLPVMTVQSP